jgi:DNA-binding XRE family transcriptional regulator
MKLDEVNVTRQFYRERRHIIASELRDLRRRYGFTQAVMAERLDVSRRTIVRGERRGMEAARGTLVRYLWCELYLRAYQRHWPSDRINPRATDFRYPVTGRRERLTCR